MDTVALRDFTPDHVTQTFEWVQDPELRRLFTMRGDPTWDTHTAYFDAVLRDPAQKVFALYAGGTHVGNCGLKNIAPDSAELWIYIGAREHRGKQYGRRGCELLLECAREMGLSRVDLHVLASNTPALRVYERLGFERVTMAPADAAAWADRGLEIARMERVIHG